MAGRTVRVRGLPAELPPDRVADKLTIHFLRSRNGGGEIADLRLLPGTPPCALITFEVPEVAQRILKAKNHTLSVGGKKYPLEVTAHVAEPIPDEIFIGACVIVDYGKLSAGKTLLRNLHKGYSNVQLNFDSKNTHCIVKGPFTELQAFSRDLLGSLNLRNQAAGEILLPSSSHEAKESGTHDHQEMPDTTESAQEMPNLPNWDQVCEKAAKVPSPREPVDGEAVEQLEDFSLVMDSDIYLYMQRFCAAEYQGVLRQHHVDVVDISSDGIAILYLQPSAGMSGDMEALREARLALQQLYQQLEVSLRKEKITKGGVGMDSQALRALMQELQELYPQLLCHEDEKQLYLIGNLVDVSQAKQFLQGSSTRRGAHTVGGSLPSHPETPGPAGAALHKPKAPMDPPGLSPVRPEPRAELKLAANFSSLRADGARAGRSLLLSRDSPPVGQVQLFGKHLCESDALGPADPAAPSPQDQPRVTTADVAVDAESQQKDPEEWDHVRGGARLTQHRALSSLGDKENSTLQHPGDSKGSSPIKHHLLTTTSRTFATTRTSSSDLESKPPDARPLLQRSSSFSLPRLKDSEKSPVAGKAGGGVSEEMSLDSLQWSYLRDVCGFAIAELCGDGAVRVSERHAGDCTVLTLRAVDPSKLRQAKWKVEALVQKCPDLVCQSMSYAELAVEGPDDGALSELCSLLRGNCPRVGLSKDKHRLYLAYPKEVLPAVAEAFHAFSSRRLRALKSSSLSPAPESAGLSGASPFSRSRDTALGAALPGGLEPLHLDISGRADPTELLRAPRLPEAEDKRSPSPWRFQQALGQEEASGHVDPEAMQGGSSLLSPSVVDKPSPAGLRASQEQTKTKLSVGEPDIARLKQVLPDRFQFARDKSRGGHTEAMGQQRSPVPVADGAPRSLPTWLYRAAATEPPAAAAEPSLAAKPGDQEQALLPPGRSDVQEEPDPSSWQRGPSLGQESGQTPLGRCDTCQGSGVTCQAPCGHALCRTCFAADSTQPACCSSSSVAPSRKISGTFKISSLSQSLPGYYRDPTLQVAYTIPDSVQGVGDPRPGQPYKGGNFCAFLPDNRKGQKTAVLLKKAFEQGLTFQIKSFNGEERVTWGLIPHKTSWDGGKARNGYPDAQYLHEVCTVLKKLGIA
ncbi:interferon-induced 35 kda protein [Limosa lapponica baueri]|uniref:RING-type E3 ubiquitin transferase n=1 Tax=Limosa lapponica baueri TaxID=1758121 RepID=A0A2I0U5F8_LIMLA|nr:interferon-induced 35 kda protein [Limosa lapponica baueri]